MFQSSNGWARLTCALVFMTIVLIAKSIKIIFLMDDIGFNNFDRFTAKYKNIYPSLDSPVL